MAGRRRCECSMRADDADHFASVLSCAVRTGLNKGMRFVVIGDGVVLGRAPVASAPIGGDIHSRNIGDKTLVYLRRSGVQGRSADRV